MALDHWLAFVTAAAILLAIPGPTVLLVVSYALGHGRRIAVAMVGGVVVGDFIAMTASMAGLGLLLEASSTIYLGLRWIGAAYLIYLGIKLWRAPVAASDEAMSTERQARPFRIFLHTLTVTALNPKGIVFFIAFVPQFLDTSQPLLPQMAILEATFIVQAALNSLAYALLAAAARRGIRKPAVQRAVNRTGGTFLIGAGVLAAAIRRG